MRCGEARTLSATARASARRRTGSTRSATPLLAAWARSWSIHGRSSRSAGSSSAMTRRVQERTTTSNHSSFVGSGPSSTVESSRMSGPRSRLSGRVMRGGTAATPAASSIA